MYVYQSVGNTTRDKRNDSSCLLALHVQGWPDVWLSQQNGRNDAERADGPMQYQEESISASLPALVWSTWSGKVTALSLVWFQHGLGGEWTVLMAAAQTYKCLAARPY